MTEGVAVHWNEMEVEKVVVEGAGGGDSASTATSARPEAALAKPDNVEAKTKASIETLWLTLCKIMKTPDKFQTWMVQYNKASTGLLLWVHLTKMVQKIAKRMGKGDVHCGDRRSAPFYKIVHGPWVGGSYLVPIV